MNRYKRFICLLVSIVLCIGLLPTVALADDEAWAEGKIEFGVGTINADDSRNNWQEPRGGYTTWGLVSWLSNIEVSLLDENMNGLKSMRSQGKMLSFEGLEAGSYYLRLEAADEKWVINEGRSNIDESPWEREKTVGPIEVGPGLSVKSVKWVLEPRAYGLKLITDDIGYFESSGTSERVYYEGFNTTFQNDGNPAVFSTHNGIYYGDSASLYSGMNTLEVPTLSDEEKVKYEFVGWTLEGDFSGKVYTTAEALGIVVRENIVLHAVFRGTAYNVTWKNGENTLEEDVNVRENTQPSYDGAAPTRTVDGVAWTFIGWSKNPHAAYGLSAEDLAKVTEDVTYYAIFQKPTADGKTIVSVEKDRSEGNVDYYIITYSDGTTYEFTITNGKDGTSGGSGADGRGIDRIEKTGSAGNVDIYTIYYTDGTTYVFTVTNGEGGLTPIPDALNGTDHFAYIIGMPDGLVHPEGNITRAEVATIFFRLLKDEVRDANFTSTNSFSDVNAGQWFNNAISTMAKMGIVKGYDDGTFRPNEGITRAEFAAIAARFDRTSAQPIYFTDTYGHWATDEISRAARNGWINGYPDGSFKPDQRITRAEAMALINRVLHRSPADEAALLENMVQWPDNQDKSKWYYLDVQEATNSHNYVIIPSSYKEEWTELQDPRDWSELEK